MVSHTFFRAAYNTSMIPPHREIKKSENVPAGPGKANDRALRPGNAESQNESRRYIRRPSPLSFIPGTELAGGAEFRGASSVSGLKTPAWEVTLTLPEELPLFPPTS